MIPSAVCDLINQILGPLADAPFIGGFIANLLSFIEQFCADSSES